MKRFISIMMCIVLTFVFAGCASEEDNRKTDIKNMLTILNDAEIVYSEFNELMYNYSPGMGEEEFVLDVFAILYENITAIETRAKETIWLAEDSSEKAAVLLESIVDLKQGIELYMRGVENNDAVAINDAMLAVSAYLEKTQTVMLYCNENYEK